MTAEPLRRSRWHESLVVLDLPESIKLLTQDTHRQLAKVQTSVSAILVGNGRFQITQRDQNKVKLREMTIELLPDQPGKARINGFQVLMVQEGEEWKPEPLQFALDEMAKEVVIPHG